MKAQLISRQRNWQPEPSKNLVTRIPAKEGSKLERTKSAKQSVCTTSEKMRDSTMKRLQNPEHVNSWKDIEGLSWLFHDDMEDY